MRVYVAENGERRGPFPVWEVRGRLEDGDLSPDTLGWHEGVPKWLPLRDLPAVSFREGEPPELEEPPPVEKPAVDRPADDRPAAGDDLGPGEEGDDPHASPSSTSASASVPPVVVVASTVPRPGSRFAARLFDRALWALLTVGALAPFSYGFLEFSRSPVAQALSLVFYLLAEAVCLALFGVTPGKALLGMRVVQTSDGHLPSFRTSLRRSFLVGLLGNALYSPFALATWIYHFIALGRNRSTIWDRGLGLSVVTTAPVDTRRLLVFSALLLGLLLIFSSLVQEDMQLLLDQGAAETPAAPESFLPE